MSLSLAIIGTHIPLAMSLFKKSWSLIDIVKLSNYTYPQVKNWYDL